MDGGESVGLGVMGCADVARRRVLPAVAAEAGIRLTAVASRAGHRAAGFARRHGGEPVRGYDALLARDDVHAVYLPLPAGLHAEWIERALLADKHVLAEKPLTTSAADTEHLVALAARRGLVLRENFMFCHHPMHAAVLALVEGGAVGELTAFSATFAIPPRPDGDIRLRPDLGGGALLDTGGYPLRAARMFLGPELRVCGAVLRDGRTGVDVGGAALLVRPDDGVRAEVTFGLADAYRSGYVLSGSSGRIEVDHVFTLPADHAPVARISTRSGVERVPLPAHDQYRTSVRAFVGAVRGTAGPPAWEPPATVRQARTTEEIHRFARAAAPPPAAPRPREGP